MITYPYPKSVNLLIWLIISHKLNIGLRLSEICRGCRQETTNTVMFKDPGLRNNARHPFNLVAIIAMPFREHRPHAVRGAQ
jgi:hypothetical protein